MPNPSATPLIMIVDDDDAGRAMCSAAVLSAGFDVVEADSVDSALEHLERFRPSAVVLDVVLPPRSGFELLQHIRRQRADAYLPVLVLTALHDGSAIARAYELGASDFATKPIHPLVLSQRLRFLLRSYDMQARLNESQARLELAQTIARLGHFEAKADDWRLRLHTTARTILGCTEREDVITVDAFLERVAKDDREHVRNAWQRTQKTQAPLHVMHRINGGDGRTRFVELHGVFLPRVSGQSQRFLGTIQDVTERQNARDQLAYLAEHDVLTGSLTRAAFVERANEVLHSSKSRIRELAILLIDIDRFSAFNETYGTAIGDEVLRRIAKRLDAIWRAEFRAPGSVVDRSGVTRIGGDQFALIFSTDARADEEGSRISRVVLDAVSQPIEHDGGSVFLTASVGIAMYPTDGRDADSLLMRAQSAAKEAKVRGSNQVRRFTNELADHVNVRRRLEPELRDAIQKRTIELHYQPKLEFATGRCRAVEALARLRRKDGTLCPPSEFLPLSEELGLIGALDMLVFEEACAQSQRWMKRGLEPIRVAVNLSHQSFWDPSLIARVKSLFATYDSGAGNIDIELTETIVMSDPSAARQRLHHLRELGLDIALDDFGTGHSSLGQVRHLPIDTLKIDRAFVSGLPDDPADVAIARAIIAMARSLNLAIVAEGVETQAQVEFVKREGCHFVQGFAIGKPMSASEVEAMF
jgi:diguanylate cyclase (GGDEF)-like protein/PAS domain S-box-containing protein